jgi:tetratricopeptide (TPR) repeat protein
MGFLKTLFGGKEETPEERKMREAARDFDVLRTDGVRALRTGQYAYAVKCFSKALEIRDDLETHDYLSQAYIQNEQLQEGYGQLTILAEAQPDNIHILASMAKVAYLMENYTLMAECCEKAMLIDKDNAEIMFLYARAARGQHDTVNAIAMYTKTLMLDENFAAANLERGQLLLDEGDIEGAADDAGRLAEVAPDAEEVLLFRASLFLRQQRVGEAISCYERALEVNPYCHEAQEGIDSLKRYE